MQKKTGFKYHIFNDLKCVLSAQGVILPGKMGCSSSGSLVVSPQGVGRVSWVPHMIIIFWILLENREHMTRSKIDKQNKKMHVPQRLHNRAKVVTLCSLVIWCVFVGWWGNWLKRFLLSKLQQTILSLSVSLVDFLHAFASSWQPNSQHQCADCFCCRHYFWGYI